jgi:integrase
VTGRRASGEGALSFNEAKQRWIGYVELPPHPDGRRNRRKITARTKKDAVARMRATENAAKGGAVTPTAKITVAHVLAAWLKAPHEWAPTTLANYQQATERICAHIGTVRIDRLTVGRVEDALAVQAEATDAERAAETKAPKGASRTYLVRQLNVLSQAIDWAARRGLVPAINPARVAQIPATANPVSEGRSLSADELTAFVAAADEYRLGVLAVVAVTIGLRPGEAAGLAWEHVDLESDPARLTVWQALRKAHTAGATVELAEPKRKARRARRTLALPAVAADALLRHRERQAAELEVADWPAEWDGLVFRTQVGTPVDAANLRRLVSQIAAAAGIDGTVTPYDLRHTAASQLADAGLSAEDVADVLGNTRVVARNTYIHVVRDVEVRGAAAMDQVLSGSKNGTRNGTRGPLGNP